MPKMEVHDLEQLPTVARWVLKESPSDIIALHGDMGVGKTTLIKSIAEMLGVEDGISSPTFSLVNEYLSKEGLIYHFDFYRVKSEEEALDMGLYEYLDSGNLCLIEWPEKIRTLLPDECTWIHIHIDGPTRIYEIIPPSK